MHLPVFKFYYKVMYCHCLNIFCLYSSDINSAAIVTVDIASILSLEDHLEGNEICVIPGRDTGLLVATIVLSILLFILIVAAVVWYFLTR